METHPVSEFSVNSRSRSLVLMALFAALLSASALFAAFVYPIPFTLQLLFVVLAALVLTPKEALGAVSLYVVLGAIGLPVFSGGRGGLGVLAGPTGGFLIGFIIAAWLGAVVAQALRGADLSSIMSDVATALIVNATIYLCGAAWMMFSAGLPLPAALTAGVVPFIIPDLIKSGVAIILAVALRKTLPEVISKK